MLQFSNHSKLVGRSFTSRPADCTVVVRQANLRWLDALQIVCCAMVLFYQSPSVWGQGSSPAEKASSPAVTAPTDTFLYAAVISKAIDVWNPLPADRLAGNIEELDERRIVFVEDEKRREIPSDRVTQVDPVWRTQMAADADKLFAARRYREAKDAIAKAVTNDLPRWQQRVLVAEFVDVFAALGEYRLAGGVYLKSLAANQPPAMLLAHMPMNWTSLEADRLHYEAAVEWLASADESAQLLGASWMLLGSDREAARAKLSKLQSSKNAALASLAVAQSWRLVPPLETPAKLAEWFEFRDRLIEPLQIGPTEFIAERCARTGMIDLALGQWSRIATVHSSHSHRAFNALSAAARTLNQRSRSEEAKRFLTWAEEFKPQ